MFTNLNPHSPSEGLCTYVRAQGDLGLANLLKKYELAKSSPLKGDKSDRANLIAAAVSHNFASWHATFFDDSRLPKNLKIDWPTDETPFRSKKSSFLLKFYFADY
ncbi:MAG: hypothetical protein HDS74_00385 [Bacteroidales bacterium]|nr:hypothetical protein [Bacteroidales bacterium]